MADLKARMSQAEFLNWQAWLTVEIGLANDAAERHEGTATAWLLGAR